MTTVTPRKAMRIARLFSLVFGCGALAVPILASNVLADEVPVTKPLIIDMTTDRTPAVTAFPRYPRIARRDRIEGDATVCFRIDAEGRVRSARLKSATHPIFKRAALRAIRASSFEPIGPRQILATARTCRTYRFRLQAVTKSDAENN